MARYLTLKPKLDFFFTTLNKVVPAWNISNNGKSKSAIQFQEKLKNYLEREYSKQDKKYPTDKNLFIFIQYIPLDIYHRLSHETPGLQAADMCCWGVFQKYERDRRAWYDIFSQDKIKFDKQYL